MPPAGGPLSIIAYYRWYRPSARMRAYPRVFRNRLQTSGPWQPMTPGRGRFATDARYQVLRPHVPATWPCRRNGPAVVSKCTNPLDPWLCAVV